MPRVKKIRYSEGTVSYHSVNETSVGVDLSQSVSSHFHHHFVIQGSYELTSSDIKDDAKVCTKLSII